MPVISFFANAFLLVFAIVTASLQQILFNAAILVIGVIAYYI